MFGSKLVLPRCPGHNLSFKSSVSLRLSPFIIRPSKPVRTPQKHPVLLLRTLFLGVSTQLQNPTGAGANHMLVMEQVFVLHMVPWSVTLHPALIPNLQVSGEMPPTLKARSRVPGVRSALRWDGASSECQIVDVQ